MKSLKRVRWAVRATLWLGLIASTIGNVLHAEPNPIAQAIAAWPVAALYLTIELFSRVPIHHRWLAAVRLCAAGLIAGIAAWISYHHMAGVAARYGETGASPYLLPLSVDGLIVVASICLVELGGRIRAAEDTVAQREPDWDMPVAQGLTFEEAIGMQPATTPEPVDSLSTPIVRERKPQPSSRDRVERAHKRTPTATNEQLAQRLNLSTRTVARWRPERPAETGKVNGKVPDLEGASS